MIFILFSLLASTLVSSAPTPTPLDAATLLQNGLDAQSLNSEFKSLQIIDACTSGQEACISNAVATCVNNQWASESCPTTQQCFALPSVRENGTFVACTSEAEALSIISATGAPGGLFSNTTANNVPFPSINCTDQASITATSATSTATDTTTDTTTDTATTATTDTTATAANDANATATATTKHHRHHNGGSTTVTVVLASGTIFTLPAQTQTISPDAAASLLSSLISNGASAQSTFSTSATSTSTTATDSATTSTSSVFDNNINAQTSPVSLTSAALTTIQLTGQVAAASTPTASSTGTSGPGYGY